MADGSGRDWYILANHGGMIERYKDTENLHLHENYANSLRRHQRILLKNSKE